MGWTHGTNEWWQTTEKSREEARRLQKTRKTTAKMGGQCEERFEKGKGGRKMERTGQQQGPMEANHESSRTSQWPVDQPHPYTRETRGRTSHKYACSVPACSALHLAASQQVRKTNWTADKVWFVLSVPLIWAMVPTWWPVVVLYNIWISKVEAVHWQCKVSEI